MATFKYQLGNCCGVIELAEISALPTPAAVIDTFLKRYLATDGTRRAFIYWTGVVGERKQIFDTAYHANRSDNYGAALADYITKHGLGPITVVPPTKNRSGNMLQVWFWAPDWDKLIARFREQAA